MKANLQVFKYNDPIEPLVVEAAIAPFDDIGNDLDLFFDGAFKTQGLGAVLYDLGRDPLSGILSREVFIKSYWAIHDLFTRPGTFEYYLDVFRSIWGEDVDVVFEVPSPGVLYIDIDVLNVDVFRLIAREIEGGAYSYNPLMDREGNNLVVRSAAGTRSQSEINALMFEIVPAGIYAVTTLTT